jgi:hypothetical protein
LEASGRLTLEHFPERWPPAFRKKMRPIKDN